MIIEARWHNGYRIGECGVVYDCCCCLLLLHNNTSLICIETYYNILYIIMFINWSPFSPIYIIIVLLLLFFFVFCFLFLFFFFGWLFWFCNNNFYAIETFEKLGASAKANLFFFCVFFFSKRKFMMETQDSWNLWCILTRDSLTLFLTYISRTRTE